MVYLQANIHAGEVEGKEAAQMLLRDLTLGPLAPLLDSLVLLVVPIYNVDGNEALAPGDTNRPGQNGPALVGRSANGQGLDLNRDYVKMEAPETRAPRRCSRWDPHVFVDLHTTNGSYHGYALTYSPGLNPNATAANDFVRDRLLPRLRSRMSERHGRGTFPTATSATSIPTHWCRGGRPTTPARAMAPTGWAAGPDGGAERGVQQRRLPDPGGMPPTTSTRELLGVWLRSEVGIVWKSRPRRRGGARTRWPFARSWARRAGNRMIVAELTEPAGQGNGGYARRPSAGAASTTIRCRSTTGSSRLDAKRCPRRISLPTRFNDIVTLLRRQGIQVGRTRPWTGLGAERVPRGGHAAAACPPQTARPNRSTGGGAARPGCPAAAAG